MLPILQASLTDFTSSSHSSSKNNIENGLKCHFKPSLKPAPSISVAFKDILDSFWLFIARTLNRCELLRVCLIWSHSIWIWRIQSIRTCRSRNITCKVINREKPKQTEEARRVKQAQASHPAGNTCRSRQKEKQEAEAKADDCCRIWTSIWLQKQSDDAPSHHPMPNHSRKKERLISTEVNHIHHICLMQGLPIKLLVTPTRLRNAPR